MLDTTKGAIVLELDPVKAPISVENFRRYVKEGFYNQTVFHRIVPNFVVQGGGFDEKFIQKKTNDPIKNEWTNGLKNMRGSISMARTQSPDSATSQFFLNLKDNPALDGANGPGYAVFGKIVVGMDVLDAMLFHQYVRGSASRLEVKGYNFFTENYSVFKPEVMTRPDPRGGSSLLALDGAQRNVAFIRKLMESDAVIIGGQAASHCVKSSIEDFLDEILAKDPALAKKVYVLRDCMSAVTVPDGKGGFYVDNTPDAEAALRKFENAGMNVVDSTTPIASWPGITL